MFYVEGGAGKLIQPIVLDNLAREAEKVRMTETARDLRERALRIREVSLGFSDDVSRTLLELAKDMEERAERLEKDGPDNK